MKNSRQIKLLELINKYDIDRQEVLQAMLTECGFRVTQATVSRDIRELGIKKSVGLDGVNKYRDPSAAKTDVSSGMNFHSILHQTVSSVAYANNLIVVKTHVGMGSAAGTALDALHLDGVIGTLAGDDTILVVASDNATAESVTAKLNELIGK